MPKGPKGEKRPADAIGATTTKHIIQLGQPSNMPSRNSVAKSTSSASVMVGAVQVMFRGRRSRWAEISESEFFWGGTY